MRAKSELYRVRLNYQARFFLAKKIPDFFHPRATTFFVYNALLLVAMFSHRSSKNRRIQASGRVAPASGFVSAWSDSEIPVHLKRQSGGGGNFYFSHAGSLVK